MRSLSGDFVRLTAQSSTTVVHKVQKFLAIIRPERPFADIRVHAMLNVQHDGVVLLTSFDQFLEEGFLQDGGSLVLQLIENDRVELFVIAQERDLREMLLERG